MTPTQPPAEPVDLRLLLTVQRRLAGRLAVGGARALSLAGEHAAAWVVVGAAGTLLDHPRRAEWVTATGAVVVAHGASVVLKRVARRHRPSAAPVLVRTATPSRWSMPSSHATSTTAAALALGPLLPRWARPVAVAAPGAMALSRVVLGVHYPSDVLVGSVLGALAQAGARPLLRPLAQRAAGAAG